MNMNQVLRKLQSFQPVAHLLKNSPVRDIQQNLKATLTQRISRYGFVSREEFDIQTQVLLRTRAKLEALERRLAQFEQTAAARPTHAQPEAH